MSIRRTLAAQSSKFKMAAVDGNTPGTVFCTCPRFLSYPVDETDPGEGSVL